MQASRGVPVADILVIDDNSMFRRIVAEVLGRAGHRVHQAADGEAGVAAFRRLRPDLVVTDIVMPEKEGIEVIRELRGEAPHLPILAMSGSCSRGDFYLHAATALGADAALAKPFRPAELVGIVADLLVGTQAPDQGENAARD